MKSLILFFIALSFCKLSAEANQSEIQSSESEVSIDNVTYEYKVFNEADNRIDCTGTINFTINIPTGCQRLLLVRTREHTVDSDRLSFSIKTQLPIVDDSSAMSVSLPDMSWGTYFRIFAYFENDRYIYSPTYCTNSYIEENDLKIILGQASIDNTIAEPIDISIDNGCLYIGITEPVELTISNLNGYIIFNGTISQSTSIPIKMEFHQMLIIRCKNNKSTIIRKFIVK